MSSEQLVVDCNATEWLGGNSVILPMNSLRSKNRNGINLFASQQPSGELSLRAFENGSGPVPRARRQPEGVSVVTLQEVERPLTDAELEMVFPSVPWRDPIRISDLDGNFAFACRFCIARHGIRGCDIPSLSMSAREVRRHIREHHPWSVGHEKIQRSVITERRAEGGNMQLSLPAISIRLLEFQGTLSGANEAPPNGS